MKRPGVLVLGLVIVVGLALWVVGSGPDAEPSTSRPVEAQPVPAAGHLPTVAPDERPEALADLASAPAAMAEPAQPLEVLPALDLRIVHADGEPAHRALVVLLEGRGATHGDAILERGETDGDGRLSFPGRAGAVEVLVGGVCWMPVRHAIEPGHGTHEVRLPEGADIAGHVLVDGHAPGRGLRLRLARAPQLLDWHHSLLSAFDRRLPGRSGERRFEVLTTTDGRFRFSGLEVGWRGRLSCSLGYEFERFSGRDLTVTAPETGIVIELRSRPVVRGRVVDVEGRPQSGAEVSARVKHRNGNGHTHELATDGGGRFEFAMLYGPVESIELVAVAHDRAGRLERTVGALDGVNDHDLGDLALVPTRRVVFRAVDLAGDPVAGAIATALTMVGDPARHVMHNARRTVEPSAPTMSDGRGQLDGLAHDATHFVVHAARHGSVESPLPPPGATEDSEVLVVMSPCALLELVVAMDGETLPRALHAVLDVEGGLMEGAGLQWDPLRTRLGVDSPDSQEISYRVPAGARVKVRVPFRETGRLLLSCLRSDVTLSVWLEDDGGAELSVPVRLTLAPREQRVLVLQPGQPAVDVAARVVDGDGHPVEGALLHLSSWNEVRSDAQGLAALGRVHGAQVKLRIEAVGYQTLSTQRPIPAPGEELRFVLEPRRP